jgi:hypothetical protein
MAPKSEYRFSEKAMRLENRDWRFSAHGLIVDLKTTERLPSAIGASHGRQGAVYATAHGNFGMRFATAAKFMQAA